MAAATAISKIERPVGSFYTGEFTLDPGSIAAGAREEQTVAVPGVEVGDVVTVSPQAALLAGIVIGHVRAAADSISFWIENHTAGAVDQTSNKWNYAVIRGSTRRLG